MVWQWDESYETFLAYILATIGRRPSPNTNLTVSITKEIMSPAM